MGSTSPNRNGEQVAPWVNDIAAQRTDAELELVDLALLGVEPAGLLWGVHEDSIT